MARRFFVCGVLCVFAILGLAHGGSIVPDSIVFEPTTSSSSSSPRFASNSTGATTTTTTTTTANATATATNATVKSVPSSNSSAPAASPAQPVDPDSVLLLSFLTPSSTNDWRDNTDFHVPRGYSAFDATRYQIDVLRGRRFSIDRMIAWLQAQKRHLEQRIAQLSGNMTLEQRVVAQRAREYFSAAQTGVKCPPIAAPAVFLETENATVVSTNNTVSANNTRTTTTTTTTTNNSTATSTPPVTAPPAPHVTPAPSPLCQYLHNSAQLLRAARTRLSALQIHHKQLVRLWKRAAPIIIDQLLILERRRADQIRLINHYIAILVNLPLTR